MNRFLQYGFWQAIGCLLFASIISVGCSQNGNADAYGQFEATEVTISSQTSGQLMQFTVDEGDELKPGVQVGWVDTTQLTLKKDELQAQVESIEAEITNINAQIDVQKEQLALAETNLHRIQGMKVDGAATAQQLDDAQAQVQILKEKIEALQSQKGSIRANINATQVRMAQVEEQTQDAKIINPVKGTVLTSFVEPFEIVREGQPLYRIADLDTLTLQVYVSGAQLPGLKLGQSVQVLVDKNAEANQSLRGKVSWIASKAEFTPQQVQTKEERVTQVYAVEVRVPNPDGVLKIGMPGEVNL